MKRFPKIMGFFALIPALIFSSSCDNKEHIENQNTENNNTENNNTENNYVYDIKVQLDLFTTSGIKENQNEGGSVEFLDNNQKGSEISPVKIKINANYGYFVNKVKFNNEIIDKNTTILNPTGMDDKLVVEFIEESNLSLVRYSLTKDISIYNEPNTLASVGGNVEVNCSNKTDYAYDKYTYKVTPSEGFKIRSIILNSKELENEGIFYVEPGENSFKVQFERIVPLHSIKDDYDCTSFDSLNKIYEGLALNERSEEKYYVYGFVEFIKNSGSNKKITISEPGNDLIIPCFKILNFADFQSEINVGDEVIFQGQVMNYNNSIELYECDIIAITNHGTNPENQNPDFTEEEYPGVVADPNKFEVVSGYKIEKIYDPKYIGTSKDYTAVNKNKFYQDYKVATTYKEAMSRTKANLLSGDKNIPSKDANYNKVKNPMSAEEVPYYNARIRYVYDDANYSNIIGYLINDLDGDDSNDTIIFKDAGYISMDEVSAYLFAFHDVPKNWYENKKSQGQNLAITNWGQYGRVNNGDFEGTRPHQPNMPDTEIFRYKEMDFGHDGNFYFYDRNGNENVKQLPYNNGTSISRGTCRFTYTHRLEDNSEYALDEVRHVFYTWTHYNDFEEYLNYKGGYGKVFGNLCVGNEYNTANPTHPIRQATPTKLALFK